jgi:ATP-binding cassette ChvD family protein
VQDQIEAKNAGELDRELDLAMHALQCPAGEAQVGKLSGGERRRVALCRVLMSHPDLLLLDEPTNHLDTETVSWLEHFLANYKGAVIAITHDRYFLDNVVGWMLEIDRGRGIPYKGNYSAYLEQKQVALDQQNKKDASRARLIKRELEWIRSNPKARSTKNKARIKSYERLIEEEREAQDGPLELQIPPGPRLGDRVLTVRGIAKRYGDKVLFDDFSFDLPKGAIVGVTGANGLGKTTLIRMIVGEEHPDAGEIQVGANTVLSYVDQNRETLDPANTVFTEITGGTDDVLFGKVALASRAYVARFLFTGEDQQKKVGDLSGGERNRVQLAKLLRKGGNLIILDEPTNDLDLQTLRVLEESLQAFAGCAIVVSHDRYFLNRVVSHILAFEGDGIVNFHHGTYEDYSEWRVGWRERMGFGPESRAGRYRRLLRK